MRHTKRPPWKRSARRREAGAAPVLLPTFFIAMVAVVLAVVAIGRTGSDLADIGAVALLLAVVAVLMVAIGRLLGEQGPSPAEDALPDTRDEDVG